MKAQFLAAISLLALCSSLAAQRGPVINQRFPIRSGDELSPPIVSPVGDCAKAVHVSGFIPHAEIRVFANHTEQIGIANPYFADADVPLTRELHTGEIVTATQMVMSFTSAQSPDPVVVGPYPAALNKPVAGPDLYACGQVVPVDHLNPGTHVTVFRATTSLIGEGDATQAWQPIVTTSLNAGDHVTAIQTACRDNPARRLESPRSDAVTVHPAPNPVPAPNVEPFPVGADAIVLDNLYVGSAIQLLDNGSPAGGGLSTASRNRAPLTPSAGSGAHITATQKLCTTSVPSPPQTPSTTLGAPVIVTPVCEGTHVVTIQGTYVNAVVVLFRNGVIAGMAGGEVGDVTINLGAGTNLNFGDELQAVQYVGGVISPRSELVFVGCGNVLTQHNDNARSGGYTVETQLTPANVRPASFGRLYTRQVDGDIVAQPLYMRRVPAVTGALRNLFFVATSKNNVYAFDADNLSATAGPIWQRNLCNSAHSGVCGETYSGFVGITSTPVIDPVSNTMYVVARCSDGTGGPRDGQILIYALNVATGADRVAPVQISAVAPGTNVAFDYHCQRNRPGLLLQNGVVYVGFATFSCDAGCAGTPYHGWVIGYRASDLHQTGVYCTSPSNATGRGEAGIWQTGKGLVGSPNGSIFFETGNGPNTEPLQNSFVKISPTTAPGGLANAGHFTPNNAGVAVHPGLPGNRSLADGDTDLGSGGPLLLPQGKLIGGGKQGRFYVVDTSTMRLAQNAAPDSLGYDGFQAFTNTYHNDSSRAACPIAGGAAGCDTSGGTTHDNQCYINPIRYGDGELCGPNIHSGPVFWKQSATTGLIYEMPEKDFLKAFKYDLTTGHVSELPSCVASGSLAKPPTDGMPGGYSSVSSSGSANGIVWTSLPNGDGQWNPVPGRLAAFDATNLKQIWSDDDNVLFAKSVPPTIGDGKVFRAIGGFPGSVIVYGSLAHGGSVIEHPPVGPCLSIGGKYANYGGRTGSTVGVPVGDERPVGDKVGGRYQDYKGGVFGIASTVVSVKDHPGDPIPTCSVPKGRTMTVLSSIYWSPNTCAHLVQGEIRELWLKLGGAQGKLGYPIADETYTPDHRGRASRFQHGEIFWYADKGAHVVDDNNQH
jgi:hypothetical protein